MIREKIREAMRHLNSKQECNWCVDRFYSSYSLSTWIEIHDRTLTDGVYDDIVRINTKGDRQLAELLEEACYIALREYYGCGDDEDGS